VKKNVAQKNFPLFEIMIITRDYKKMIRFCEKSQTSNND